MNLQVAHFSGGVGESTLAVLAVVRLLATVHQLVPLQVTRCSEEFSTIVTAVARLACVPLPVQVQQADLPVALPAGGTAVWFYRAGHEKRYSSTHVVLFNMDFIFTIMALVLSSVYAQHQNTGQA